MGEFLAFRKMITPMFMQIIFIIGALVAVLFAIWLMLSGGFLIVVGLIYLFLGPILVRVWCELVIILFRIYDELVAMRTGVAPAGRVQHGFPVTPVPATPVSPPPAQ